MNNLTIDFKKYVVAREDEYGIYRTRLRFPNDYGASIIVGTGTYGLELAVIHFIGDNDQWDLDYDTPITDDVIGYLDESSLTEILNKIKNLGKYEMEEK